MSSPTIPVFRQGKWISYSVPVPLDPLWGRKHVFRAASFYATACEQGIDSVDAAVLAELFINKQIYEGLAYDTVYEMKLKQIMDHVETA